MFRKLFFRKFFFRIIIRIPQWNLVTKSYDLHIKDTQQTWCRSAHPVRKVLVKIEILFTSRIMNVLWISIPQLHFIHERHPQNFVWMRQLLQELSCFQTGHTDVRTDSQTGRQVNFFFFCSSQTYKTWPFIKRRLLRLPYFFFSHTPYVMSK